MPGRPALDRPPEPGGLQGARRRARLTGEGGAAVPEFVLTMTLFLLVVMAVLQVGFAVYLRNSLLQCAVEGARYGGRADVSAAEGAARAAELSRGFLGGHAGDAASATTRTIDGVQVVEVTIRSSLPVVGTFGPSGALVVHGQAYEESQR